MKYVIALAGNPNSGKTTLFNALTGSNQYVGNWPGVTVERKEALFQMGEDEVTLTDLPGVYSLSPYSIEENITRHFIAQHRPDVVLNIVDATNLERNLFLTLQLMELERPLVIALNLMDEIERHGGKIDCDRLSQLLGAPVVPISAKKRTGFDELFTALQQQAHHPVAPSALRRYDAATRMAVASIVAALGGAEAHSAFDEPEHFAHRDARHRDDDHTDRRPNAHIGGYEDEGYLATRRHRMGGAEAKRETRPSCPPPPDGRHREKIAPPSMPNLPGADGAPASRADARGRRPLRRHRADAARLAFNPAGEARTM
jgi:small GTP-binding protein